MNRPFKSIPGDVWLAAAAALGTALVAIVDIRPAIFLTITVALCAYVVIKVFDLR